MRRLLLSSLAIFLGFLAGPALHAGWQAQKTAQRPASLLSETHILPVLPDFDPIAPAGYDGALLAYELTPEQNAGRAQVVVVGRVSTMTSHVDGGTINTDVTLDVEKTLKGPAGSTVTFLNPGGKVGSRQVLVGDIPQFVTGERVLVFLDRKKASQPLSLVHVFTSKFTLAGTDAVQTDGKRSVVVPIKQLEDRLKPVLGAKTEIGTTTNSSGPSRFALLASCPAWKPNQFPIVYSINDANPAPGAPVGFAHYDIIYRSLLMWQQLPDSALAFSIGGSTAVTGSSQDGVNAVVWTDISQIPGMSGGVIGLNYCLNDGVNRLESDTLLSNYSKPGDSFPWDSNPDDGITGGSLSTRSVAGHEFGHGIKLDHSADVNALMYFSIPVGVNKLVNADDQAGAAFVNPLSGAPPGAPSGLTVSQNSPTSNILSWAGAAGGFAYEIERASPDCNAAFRSINTVASTTTRYLDNNYGFGLTSGATYCYRVKSLGAGGDSPYSNATGGGAGSQPTWVPVSGLASWIAAGPNPAGGSAVWALDRNRTAGGFGIYRWTGQTWTYMQGGAIQLSIDASGNAFAVQDSGAIYRWTGAAWVQFPGIAKFVSVGVDSSLFALSTDPGPGGFGIYRWDGQTWVFLGGYAKELAAGNDGSVYALQDTGAIYQWRAGTWTFIPASAASLAVSTSGTLWATSTAPASGGHPIYRWTGSTWLPIIGSGERMALGVANDAWVVQSNGAIYKSP